MKYYSREIQKSEYLQKTAGVKARDDVEAILKEEGYSELLIPSLDENRKTLGKVKKVATHFHIRKIWKDSTKNLTKGDEILIQYPTIEHSIFLSSVFRDLRKKGVRIIFLIHDLEYMRLVVSDNENMTKSKGRRLELEQKALHFGNRIIVHNEAMIEKMCEIGFDRNKLISLEIFDYLIPDFSEERTAGRKNQKDMPVIIAGNLKREKAEYVYNLPDTVEFNLFGVNYEDTEKSNIHYMGAFAPDELPYSLNGSFGLVWDGTMAENCSGVFGNYLKINNPHKTSLYLASGIPVIIWSKAALADFIIGMHAGITVDSLYDIPQILSNMSEEEYDSLVAGARELSEKLRKGFFLRKALENAHKSRMK